MPTITKQANNRADDSTDKLGKSATATRQMNNNSIKSMASI